MDHFNGSKHLVKTFLLFLVSFGYVFTTIQAQAEEPDLVSLYYKLNNNKSVYDMGALAKEFFKTKEDHRLIDNDVESWAKKTKKWKWRFDVKRSGIVEFRVNGKVQLSTKVTQTQQKVFEINGEKVIFADHLSYLSYQNAISKILRKKQVNLESLLMDKAYAGIPALFGFAALALTGVAVSNELGTSTPSAVNNQNPQVCMRRPHLPTHLGVDGAAYWEKVNYTDFNGNGMRCRNLIPTDGTKRLAMVIENYKPNGKFRRGQAHKNCQHLPNATQAQQFTKAKCECIERKIFPSCDPGWDMTRQGAERICETALSIYKSCNTQRRAVPVISKVSNSYDPVTPCYKDKNGNYPAGCNSAANHCNVDANGNPPPGCPGYNPDPVTPAYSGKITNAEVGGPSVGAPTAPYSPSQPQSQPQPQAPAPRQPLTDNNHGGGNR